MNSNIYIKSETVDFYINNPFFAFYNTTLHCDNIILIECNIHCNTNNSRQFLIIDNSCNECLIDTNCTIIDSLSIKKNKIDHISFSLINQIIGLIDQFAFIYQLECNNNYSQTYDIGYPLYFDTNIININYSDSTICCRGYQSCSYTNNIYSYYGNILCQGAWSCAQTGIIETPSNIFCMAYVGMYYICLILRLYLY